LQSCAVGHSADSESCLEVDHIEDNEQLNSMWLILMFVMIDDGERGFIEPMDKTFPGLIE
jgi:hypothetical protein